MQAYVLNRKGATGNWCAPLLAMIDEFGSSGNCWEPLVDSIDARLALHLWNGHGFILPEGGARQLVGVGRFGYALRGPSELPHFEDPVCGREVIAP